MAKALTAQSVERLKADPARRLEVPDGLMPGLYLVVQPTGVRSWAVRYRYAGKPRKLTLGAYPALDLATARTNARLALRVVAEGRDPGAEKRLATATPGADLVQTVVRAFIERHVRPNTRRRTAEETERTFRKHVLPTWGDRPIQDIAAGT